jgi:hypothetical protein
MVLTLLYWGRQTEREKRVRERVRQTDRQTEGARTTKNGESKLNVSAEVVVILKTLNKEKTDRDQSMMEPQNLNCLIRTSKYEGGWITKAMMKTDTQVQGNHK